MLLRSLRVDILETPKALLSQGFERSIKTVLGYGFEKELKQSLIFGQI